MSYPALAVHLDGQLHHGVIKSVSDGETFKQYMERLTKEKNPPDIYFSEVSQVQITLGENGQYRWNTDYFPSGKFGDKNVYLVTDRMTGPSHVKKIIEINSTEYNPNEIIAMRKVNVKSDFAPHLKMVHSDGGFVSLHMEYLNGPTFYEACRIMDRSKYVETEVPVLLSKVLTKQLLEGIEHLHTQGVTHQDLHDKNIILQRGGLQHIMAKVIDFGSTTELLASNKHIDILQILTLMCRMCGIPTSNFSGVDRLRYNWKMKLDQVSQADIDEECKECIKKVFREGDIDNFQKCDGILNKLEEKINENPKFTDQVMRKAEELFFNNPPHRSATQEEQGAILEGPGMLDEPDNSFFPLSQLQDLRLQP